MTTGAASISRADDLVDCNRVVREDRCACNARILRALNQPGAVFSEGDSGPSDVALLTHQERQHRLRTFWTPRCENGSDPTVLPAHERQRPPRQIVKPTVLKPFAASSIAVSTAPGFLVGRWHGWESLGNQRPRLLALEIMDVDGVHVRACSNHGLLLGRLHGGPEGGPLELYRPAPLSFGHSIQLWRSGPPHDRDLEGVVIFEPHPGHELVVGLVWLSRPTTFPGITQPSLHPCQDLPHEDTVLKARLRALTENIQNLLHRIKELESELNRPPPGGGPPSLPD